jgi:UV DNA damage endonuclease
MSCSLNTVVPDILTRFGKHFEQERKEIFKNNIRLGYACINMTLRNQKTSDFPKGICVNRSCIAKTFETKGKAHAIDLVKLNLEAVIRIIEWNFEQTPFIQLYRLSSDMFPHLTNPKFCQGEDYAYSLTQFTEYFNRIGEVADKCETRITFHPGPYNQVGTPSSEVFAKTKKELRYHAEVLDLCHRDLNSVMVVHGGGTYCNKEKIKKRWVKQFKHLTESAQRRIVIENCERAYHYRDVLDLAHQVGRPVVFDTHHHNCYNIIMSDNIKCIEGSKSENLENIKNKDYLPHPSIFLPEIVKTWTDLELRPKFHVSEQNPDKKIGAHSDYVEKIPHYLFDIAKNKKLCPDGIDIMIEAKQKEKAVLKLYKKYNS